MRERDLRRVDDERFDDEDMPSLVEGAYDGAHQRLCEIHDGRLGDSNVERDDKQK